MTVLQQMITKLAEHMGPVGVDIASLAFFVVTLLGLSLLSWRYFERPFIRWGRAVSSGMARPQQKAA